jgi:hypothetical protein
MIESRRIKWAGCIAQMGKRNAYRSENEKERDN